MHWLERLLAQYILAAAATSRDPMFWIGGYGHAQMHRLDADLREASRCG